MNIKKNFAWGSVGVAAVFLLLAGISIASAALTFSGTTISGDSGVVIESSSTISVDNSLTVQGVAGIGTTVLDSGQGLNVLAFGAKCDGSTNDSSAIQSAINQASSTGGGEVIIPAGVNCVANVTLPSNVALVGPSTVSLGDLSTASRLTDGSDGTAAVITVANGAVGWAVRNLALYGTGSGSTTGDRGIYIPNGSSAEIDNVWCDQFDQECIRHVSGTAIRIENSGADNTLLNRSRVSHDGALYISGTDDYIIDSEFGASINREGHSISSNCYNDGVADFGANNFYSNVIGETSELGWYIDSSDSRYGNIRGDSNYCSGAWVAGSGNTIQAHFIRNGRDGASAWDGVETSGANNIIYGTIIDQSTGNTLTDGFTDTESSDSNANSYYDDELLGTTGNLYNFAGFAGALFSTPDKAAITIASGTASPNVSGRDFFSFNQSSPITITSFTGGVYGQQACFVGNTNVTFSTGGDIAPEFSPETLQSGRIYCYIDSNGTWTELAPPLPQNVMTSSSPTFAGETVQAANAILTVKSTNASGSNAFLNLIGSNSCTASIFSDYNGAVRITPSSCFASGPALEINNSAGNPFAVFMQGGNVGIGTTTPATALQVAGSSTIRIGAGSVPGCLELMDSSGNGTINYLTATGGVLSATTTKPSSCQ